MAESALVRASAESAALKPLDDASWPVTTTVDVAERAVTDADVTLTPCEARAEPMRVLTGALALPLAP